MKCTFPKTTVETEDQHLTYIVKAFIQFLMLNLQSYDQLGV